jgi:hypothetical protein
VRTSSGTPSATPAGTRPSPAADRLPGRGPGATDAGEPTEDDHPTPSRREPTMAGSRLDSLAVRVLQQFARRRWGFPPSIMEPLVQQLGPVRAVRWVRRADYRYDRALRALGPLRTHLACVTISLLNGCRYCAYGHAYALELHHLDLHGRLFPEPAATVAGWAGLSRNEVRSRLRDALMQADLHVELIWVDRALDLADGGQPIDDQETRMAHLVGVFETLNAVGIAGQPELDEAHDPLNRDTRLKARLAALRAAQCAD